MKIIYGLIQSTLLLAIMMPAMAVNLLPPYDATYVISRDNKPTAEQHTSFTQMANNHYQLIDTTEGTHGLAALSGFERNEKSLFKMTERNLKVTEHVMRQAVAFSKKSFHFHSEDNSNIISGKHKKEFSLTTESAPISSHMLPIWISALVCSGETTFSIAVLKSQNIKTYDFKANNIDQQLIRVERVYPAEQNKTTQIWFDSSRHCLPVKTRHQDGNDPVIETKLKSFTLQKSNLNEKISD